MLIYQNSKVCFIKWLKVQQGKRYQSFYQDTNLSSNIAVITLVIDIITDIVSITINIAMFDSWGIDPLHQLSAHLSRTLVNVLL